MPSHIGDEKSEHTQESIATDKVYSCLSEVLDQIYRKRTSLLPSFKKKVNIEWMEEYKRAFQDLKKFLVEPPVLSKPRNRQPLYVYLLVTEKAISSVLIREDQK